MIYKIHPVKNNKLSPPLRIIQETRCLMSQMSHLSPKMSFSRFWLTVFCSFPNVVDSRFPEQVDTFLNR